MVWRICLLTPKRCRNIAQLFSRITRSGFNRACRSGSARRLIRTASSRKPRTKTPVDPVLAARVKQGLQRLTGLEARVAPGKIELAYTDERDLEELADALDRI